MAAAWPGANPGGIFGRGIKWVGIGLILDGLFVALLGGA